MVSRPRSRGSDTRRAPTASPTVREVFDQVVAQLPRGARVAVYRSEYIDNDDAGLTWTVEVFAAGARGVADEATPARAARRALQRYHASLASRPNAAACRLAV
jgi:hypothetical protein